MYTEITRYKELADFLKTRRSKVTPSQVGLSSSIRRRTPGLRREEIAQLAGIGITWYTWLEQGRPIQVSSQVVESLSRVLFLDKEERNHLYQLANLPLPIDTITPQETVTPILQHVLDSLYLSPAILINQRWNVIAWNQAACIVLGDFLHMNERERNIVWAMFTNQKYKQLYVDWNLHAKNLLARFRSSCSQYIEDSWFSTFVDELKLKSQEFSQLWPLHEILSHSEVCKQLNHEKVGLLDFEVSKFDVADLSGLTIIIHTPLVGTETANKIKTLLEEKGL